MGSKSLVLVAGSEQTRNALVNQLKEYISDLVSIKSYAIDEGIDDSLNMGQLILSSRIVYEELQEKDLLSEEADPIIARRTINYERIDQIFFLPDGEDVIFVNDVKETAVEGIKSLKRLGIDFLNFIPFYPERKEMDRFPEVAITPGEVDKVPEDVSIVYDIGPRLMDFTTIVEIMNQLGILEYRAVKFSESYLKKIIAMARKLANSASEISKLNDQLNLVVDGLHDGVLVYNSKGHIIFANEKARDIFNSDFRENLQRNMKNIIHNKKIITFLMKSDNEEKTIAGINNREFIVRRLRLPDGKTFVALFKSIKETLEERDRVKKELMKKGFYAKYNFDDIIGSSPVTLRVKEIARKLAKTELTILIEGESGTGKELFASAIHNASGRSKGPFLAVNFSALPEDLIESELFGYEEGAFTGARKGGKEGLFEQADGGTIFLDEIGDVSSKVQARLLRVLEEKEVMRLGGDKIKSVDLRVIAATNRNLGQMVADGEFREDLYYRLKMGYFRIPPLRERKDDLIELIEYFIKTETTEEIKVDNEVINRLLGYSWYGNVRELKNTLSYMLAVSKDNYLKMDDLPQRDFFQQNSDKKNSLKKNCNELDEELSFILKTVYEFRKNHKKIGRKSLAVESQKAGFNLTVNQIRYRLNKLEEMGYIDKKKGPVGTVLTKKGKKLAGTISEK